MPFWHRIFRTLLTSDNNSSKTSQWNIMKFYLHTLKHLVIQLVKLQIYTLNLTATFWHCKKKSHYFWTGVYNAHADPIFRSLNLLKIADIFKLHSLKFYYNYVHHELPHYFQEFDFSTNHDVHNYETRQGHHIPANITMTRMAQKCVRHNVNKVVNSTDQNIMQSINITCAKGFDLLIKNNLIKNY